ncbi:MAG: anti-sigma factor [Polyangiaceae bacterium]
MEPRDLPAENRSIGGLYCTEVLERLSAYLDGDLSAEEASRVRAHVAHCTTCERFGGRFAAAVQRLREAEPPPLDEDLDARLGAALGLSR